MRNRKKLRHIWPQYINADLKLSEGRKISIEDAVKEPTLKDMEKALKKLNIEFETFPEHKYPGKWYEKSGEIVVNHEGNKLELLRDISSKIKEFRH